MFKQTPKLRSGFTLIELLVVIAIISLLSSVVLASLSGARAGARDARRQRDFRQIKTALELYYNDHGHYPKCPVSRNYIDEGSVCPPSHAGSALEDGGYLQEFPVDPLYGNDGSEDWRNDYQYRTFEDGQVYVLRTAFENKLERTHDYPAGKFPECSSSNPVCEWSESRCVYVTPGDNNDCDAYWLQINSGAERNP